MELLIFIIAITVIIAIGLLMVETMFFVGDKLIKRRDNDT